jgi:hypothetical protein
MKYLPLIFFIAGEIAMALTATIVYFMWHFKFNKEFIENAYTDVKEVYKDIRDDR